ncbi:MAG: alpha/beta hydrolase [Anaerolineae bacterium]|nr:alpha/beta hydrolase [Anaerolineae bacterium]
MSSIVTTEGIVHYEMDGRGQPVILLHGWINSWAVWRETMIDLAQQGPFKVYALDFWGFGDSAKERTPPFRIDSYVGMVEEFLEIMGIQQAPVIGHSMGGTVALSLAFARPDCVRKVAVVGAPVVGSSLHPLLKIGSARWVANTLFRIPAVLRFVVWLVLAGDSQRIQHMIFRDVSRANAESFFRSIGDLWRTDLRPYLDMIRVPVLGVFGQHDNIVRPEQGALLSAHVPHAEIEMMSGSRHFPMLDEPERFREVLLGFLSDADS